MTDKNYNFVSSFTDLNLSSVSDRAHHIATQNFEYQLGSDTKCFEEFPEEVSEYFLVEI